MYASQKRHDYANEWYGRSFRTPKFQGLILSMMALTSSPFLAVMKVQTSSYLIYVKLLPPRSRVPLNLPAPLSHSAMT